VDLRQEGKTFPNRPIHYFRQTMEETDMTDSAPEIAPNLVGLWTMEVIDLPDPPVKDLDEIDIYFQEEGMADTPLYGSVNSKAPDTSKFSMENATVTNSQTICFDVTIYGQVYQFTGTIKTPQSMYGTITLLVGGLGGANEEGSWSAQAQGGGED
jgi:hypothetical protein